MHALCFVTRALPDGNNPYPFTDRSTTQPPLHHAGLTYHRPMHCLGCDYNLQGLSDHRCPECGRPFDPANQKTWSLSKSVRRAQSCQAIGRLLVIIAAIIAITAIYLNAKGEDVFLTFFLTGFVGCIALCFFMVIWLILGSTTPQGVSSRVFFAIAICAIIWLSVSANWPLKISLAFSQPTLNRIITNAQAGNLPTAPVDTGLFQITDVEQRAGCWVLWDGQYHEKAFVYKMSDADIPKHFNPWSWHRINNDWHLVIED